MLSSRGLFVTNVTVEKIAGVTLTVNINYELWTPGLAMTAGVNCRLFSHSQVSNLTGF